MAWWPGGWADGFKTCPDPGTDHQAMTATRTLVIAKAAEEHADAIAEFFRQVWNPEASGESVRAAWKRGATENLADPGVPAPTWIAIHERRVIGYVTTLPVRVWNGSGEVPTYWIKGLMVLPAFRGGPIGHGLLKAATRELSRAGGFAVAQPAQRLFTALGYQDLGVIPNWIFPLRTARLLRAIDLETVRGLSPRLAKLVRGLRVTRTTGLAGIVADTLVRSRSLLHQGSGGSISTGPYSHPDRAELDDFWALLKPTWPLGVVRDARYLMQRYDPATGKNLWIGAWKDARLAGLAILRRPGETEDPRLGGAKLTAVSEVLHLPHLRVAGAQVLAGVIATARQLGADALLASASAPALRGLLARQGFVSLAGNVHFLFRSSTGSPAAGKLDEWWLTRGDGGADDAF